MADEGYCIRCHRQAVGLRTVYLGLAHRTDGVNVLPVNAFGISGGTLEICSDCHAEWLAAIKTWFENPTDNIVVKSKTHTY